MTRATIAGGAFATVLVSSLSLPATGPSTRASTAPRRTSPAITPSTTSAAAETHPASETHEGSSSPDHHHRGRHLRGAAALGGQPGAFWATTSTAQGREPLGRPRAARAAAQGAPPDRDLRDQDRRPGESDHCRPAFHGPLRRHREHRGARRQGGAGHAQGGTVFDLDRFAAQRLRRRRAGVGRQVGRRRPRQSADPQDRPPPHPSLGAAPYRCTVPCARGRATFTGFVQWDREEWRRPRRARRPHRRRRAEAAFRHHPLQSRAARATARW